MLGNASFAQPEGQHFLESAFTEVNKSLLCQDEDGEEDNKANQESNSHSQVRRNCVVWHLDLELRTTFFIEKIILTANLVLKSKIKIGFSS